MTQYKYYLLSLLVHVLVFGMFVVLFDSTTPVKKFGNTQASAVSAFIYQGDFTNTVSKQEEIKKVVHPDKNIAPKEKPAEHAIDRQHSKVSHEKSVKQMARSQASVSQGESAATLVALLHDAIQRKQQYPASAWEMQREGRVTVAFQLYGDGHISHLRLLTGSGTSSLDQAAIQAVNDAAPFHEVVAYMKQTQEYQIDIVFELS